MRALVALIALFLPMVANAADDDAFVAIALARLHPEPNVIAGGPGFHRYPRISRYEFERHRLFPEEFGEVDAAYLFEPVEVHGDVATLRYRALHRTTTGVDATVGSVEFDLKDPAWTITRVQSEPDKRPPLVELPFRVGKGVSAPAIVTQVPPTYPEEERLRRTQGIEIVQLWIDATGAITDVEVLKSLSPVFDAEAIRTVRQWTFRPAQRDGKPVAAVFNLTLNFRLTKDGNPPSH